jgi:NitT/TauT family transport system substrate-binding protein
LKPSDVTVVGVGNGPVAYAAIQNGKIDAISSVDPVISQLSAHNLIKILVDSRTDKGLNEVYGGEYPSGCLLATGDFIRQNPNTVQALANAIVQALKFIHASTADQIMAVLPANLIGTDRALYRASIEKNINTVARVGLIPEDGIKNVLRVVSAADPSVAAAKIDIGATYTNKFTKKALESIK